MPFLGKTSASDSARLIEIVMCFTVISNHSCSEISWFQKVFPFQQHNLYFLIFSERFVASPFISQKNYARRLYLHFSLFFSYFSHETSGHHPRLWFRWIISNFSIFCLLWAFGIHRRRFCLLADWHHANPLPATSILLGLQLPSNRFFRKIPKPRRKRAKRESVYMRKVRFLCGSDNWKCQSTWEMGS